MDAVATPMVLTRASIVRPRGLGEALRLRPAGEHDVEKVGAFLRGLSPEARYRRFHAGVAGVSDRVVGRLLTATPPARQALVLERGRSRGLQIVGLAQYARENDSTAEVALVVGDRWQRLGLGTRLLAALAEAAAPHYRTLSAYVQADNTPVLALLRSATDGMVAQYQGSCIRLTWAARATAAEAAA